MKTYNDNYKKMFKNKENFMIEKSSIMQNDPSIKQVSKNKK